jgi:hypothetical protein
MLNGAPSADQTNRLLAPQPANPHTVDTMMIAALEPDTESDSDQDEDSTDIPDLNPIKLELDTAVYKMQQFTVVCAKRDTLKMRLDAGNDKIRLLATCVASIEREHLEACEHADNLKTEAATAVDIVYKGHRRVGPPEGSESSTTLESEPVEEERWTTATDTRDGVVHSPEPPQKPEEDIVKGSRKATPFSDGATEFHCAPCKTNFLSKGSLTKHLKGPCPHTKLTPAEETAFKAAKDKANKKQNAYTKRKRVTNEPFRKQEQDRAAMNRQKAKANE